MFFILFSDIAFMAGAAIWNKSPQPFRWAIPVQLFQMNGNRPLSFIELNNLARWISSIELSPLRRR